MEIIVSISSGFAALPTAIALVEKLGAAAIVRFINIGWLGKWEILIIVISSVAEKSLNLNISFFGDTNRGTCLDKDEGRAKWSLIAAQL
ncbi:hypothetical protein ACFOWA_04420 [Pedobacter lithocola]|uniref:Uncharacterized protein n=1 Tax=Pedobacter lithocola TaxID=1908239 RepID=A0ABV8P579_9SPHI